MVIPDALAARSGRISDGALLTTCVCGVLFTLLQWHWGALIIKQVRKMLAPPGRRWTRAAAQRSATARSRTTRWRSSGRRRRRR